MKNTLGEFHPDLSKEWHPTKNGDLSPFDVSYGSAQKVWWKCPKGEDHEWESTVNNRTRGKGQGCPVCTGQKVVLSNCLATVNPELSKEWCHSRNGKLTPYDVTPYSGKKVWWKCPKGDDHIWLSSISNRSKGQGCGVCRGLVVVDSTCLKTLNPEIAVHWHPYKNGKLTPRDVTPLSNKKVWWKCPKGDDHEWRTSVAKRTNGRNCPICSGRKTSVSNALSTLYPEIAKEWHPTKNGDLSPNDVVANSHKKVWWKCPEGDDHEWKAQVSSRTRGQGCSVCRGLTVVNSNSLATLNERVAQEWHPTKNGKLTPKDVPLKSGKRVWWQCKRNPTHEWKTSIDSRTYKGTDCPYCTLTPQSRQELTISFELQQFFQINPKGFKTRINGTLHSVDIFISQLNLAIEFDGSYWHKGNREFDQIKSEQILSAGFDLLRIREEPLKPINEFDIVSMKPFNPKMVTDNILKFILDRYELSVNQLNDIIGYVKKNKVQNEKALEKYVDQILKEKEKRRDMKDT
ncbi:zinc-ribbon domain-containing protein [Robiginitalea sp. IMCC43444]|uniref:zinc-ribbon domain-containing protein n=1 Tax=Robiginitalea sp. IMCC43444 TaxID=3459121 RepID=UPI0040419B8B